MTATFHVIGFGLTTNEALADARDQAARWTAGDDRWHEVSEDYNVHFPFQKKNPPLVQCTLWLETVEELQ